MWNKLLGQFLQRLLIVDDHLAQPRETGVRVSVVHVVGNVVQAEHSFPVVNPREQDHGRDIGDNKVQVSLGEVEIESLQPKQTTIKVSKL